MSDNFKILSDAHHVSQRFEMYGGSRVAQEETVFVDGNFEELSVIGGLLKIVNEIIDNSVDEHVRTQQKFATKIDVSISDDGHITVKDNGRGIPSKKVDTPDGPEYQMVSAFTRARAGTNFDDDNRESMGMNGIGSMITFVTSEYFEAVSCDGTNEIKLVGGNGEIKEVTERSKKTKGTQVTFKPDYKFFGLENIDENHTRMIKERVKSLALAFPSISFTFNKKKTSSTFRQYFGPTNEFQTGNARFGVVKSNGSFQSHSIVNGLGVKGGAHIDFFVSEIIAELRPLLKRRRKLEISAARLKQHLRVHCVINKFPALKFDSQTKERVTNSAAECRAAIGEFKPDLIARKIFADRELIEEICAFSKLQADLAAKKDLNKLEKKKRVKSENFVDSIGKPNRIFVVEGLSALSGTLNCLGRKGNAYYALRGVPLNVYDVTHQKFMANKELSELYTIITTYPDAEICIATDADADGSRIRGLVALFIYKYFRDHLTNGKLRNFQTPIAIGKKGNTVKEWAYTFTEVNHIDSKLDIQYQKGLGSWSEKDLRDIIAVESLEKMLPVIKMTDEGVFRSWFSAADIEYRKEQVLNAAPFDVMKI